MTEFGDPKEVEGLLFIGDPHLSSAAPGRRTDESFADTVLAKIEFCIETANERRFLPVFLGDMYDRPVEPRESLKTRLTRILKSCWIQPIANVGNHDIANAVLCDDDSLAGLEASGALKLRRTGGALEMVRVGDKTIGIGCTPYGQMPPSDARPFFGSVDTIVWLTHHDVAFEKAYPGAMPAFPILGCPLVVNGHMHMMKKALKAGRTLWVNFGNITRQHYDAIDHEPAVWALGATSKFEKIAVPHRKERFDLTGTLIDAISPGEEKERRQVEAEAADAEGTTAESAFVEMLRNDTGTDMRKSANGDILLEEIRSKFDRDRTNVEVQDIVLKLHRELARAD